MKNEQASLDYRNRILDALNEADVLLLSRKYENFDEAMNDSLKPIAKAADLDRIIIYKVIDTDPGRRFGQVYRWDKTEGGLVFLDEELKILPDLPVLQKWVASLSNGNVLNLYEDIMTEDEKAFLSVYGTKSMLLVPVFTNNEVWGAVTFNIHTPGHIFDEDSVAFLSTAARLCANAIIRNENTQSEERAIKALKQREKMLKVLNETAIVFLSHKDEVFDEMMNKGMTLIADALDLDRVTVYRNNVKPDGLKLSQIYRWEKKSGGTTVPNSALVDIPYDKFAPSWESAFTNNLTVNSPISLMPPDEAAALKQFGIVSVFASPIFINKDFWGFMCFEDQHNERVFDEASAEMMRSAAFLCARAIIHTESSETYREQSVRLALVEQENEADERAKLMLDTAPIGINFHGMDFEVIDCNKTNLDKFGVPDKEEYKKNFHSYSPEYQPNGERSKDILKRLHKKTFERKRFQFEWMHQKPNGELFPCEVTFIPSVYKGEDVTISYMRDISHEKEAEELAQKMLDAAPFGAVIWNSNLEILNTNDELVRYFDLKDKQEFIDNFDKLSTEYQPNGERSQDVAVAALKKAFDEGYHRIEFEHINLKGVKIPCEITFVRIKHKDEYLVIAYSRDLREEKKMLAEIQEAHETLQILLDATPLSIALIDKDFKCIFANEGSVRLFGLSSKQEYIDGLYTLIHPEYQPGGSLSRVKSPEYIGKAFKEGYWRGEWMHQMPNGDPVPCDLTLVRVKYKGEDVIAGYARDLREEKAYLAEIESARNAAEAANHAKTLFLANMSHEIRTPMNSIMGFAELARSDDIPQKTKDYLGKISESTELLLAIINDILDISKIESGRMELERVPFDLHSIFDYCRTAILPKAEEKGLTLYCYAEPSVGKKLVGDPVKLRQALLNILSNAVKFTNTGTVKLLASIKNIDEASAGIHFEVKDSGIGMDADQIANIFKPFKQADSSITRKYGGTGLGLTITKNIIELMGGAIEVESAPGVGSKFSFDLTFDVISDTDGIPSRKTDLSEFEKPYFKGEILICEDNVMNQQVITEHLSRVGLKTVIAENGKEGVDAVKKRIKSGKKPFDLIFMDIHMPVMDGLEAAKTINKMTKEQVPIIALTANIMTSDREAYLAMGMRGCLSKPFTTRDLWSCLLKYLTPVKMVPLKNAASASDAASVKEDDGERRTLAAAFVKGNQNTFKNIVSAIEKGNIKLAHRIAHTLKGTAGLVGQTSLQEAAKSVEISLAGGKAQVTKDKMDLLEFEFKNALKELASFAAPLAALSDAALAGSESNTPPKIYNREEALAFLEKLDALLEENNIDSFDLVGELKSIPGTQVLAEQVENFDYNNARDTLAAVKENLKEEAEAAVAAYVELIKESN